MPRRNGTGIALLADETRRKIVAALAVRPSRPATLASAIGLSRPATSRQLRLLREARLIRAVRSRIDRRGYVYSLDPDARGRITAWLAGTEVGLDRPKGGVADPDRMGVPGRAAGMGAEVGLGLVSAFDGTRAGSCDRSA